MLSRSQLRLLQCPEPSRKFKPQWAYATPAGFRDETYMIPFQFTIDGTGTLVRGIPWSLDDDQPFLLQGIFFPQLGNWPIPGAPPTFPQPGFCRIWDTHGNPLSQGLVFALGMWSLAGLVYNLADNTLSTFAWGFPIEPAIECAPGGTILFDFQIDTNATVAAFGHAGVAAFINFTAGVWGTSGNGRTIQLINPGAPNHALTVAVVGGVNVQVTLATDGGGVITTTFQDVVNLLNNSSVTNGIMGATLVTGPGSELITAFGPSALVGAVASSPRTIMGTLLGKKRFKAC